MKLRVIMEPKIIFDLVILGFLSWCLYQAIQGINGKYDCQMAKLYNYSEDKLEIFCKGAR